MSLFDFLFAPSTDNAKPEPWQFKHWQVLVIRSHRRKTLSLELKPHQPITVRVNKRTSKKEIEKILQEKSPWLQKNLHKLNLLPATVPTELKDGDKIYFLGKKLSIRRSVTTLKSIFLVLADDHIELLLPPEMFREQLDSEVVHQVLRQFYIREAKKYLPQFVARVSQRTGLSPKKLRIGFMKTRWGSCSTHGRISLNSKIMAAPNWVIESVIIHELCHLRHMNHSKEYWDLAESLCANHQAADQWLHQRL